MKAWRFLDTGASSASLNMAIDQAMLAMHAGGKAPATLRIYQWNPPAISLGYFQRHHGIDLAACQILGIDVVRRPTGGRAVLHLGDLTYAVVAGSADGMPSSVSEAYRSINECLLAAFRILGFEAELGRKEKDLPCSDICFLTATEGDIIHQGKKFVGSAQTWHGSSMLQHGSIVLEPHDGVWTDIQSNTHALPPDHDEALKCRMTSLRDILGRVPEAGELGAAIRQGMSRTLGIEFNHGGLTSEEWTIVRKISDQVVEEESRLSGNLHTGHRAVHA